MCDTGCRLAGRQVLAGPYLSQQRDPYCLCQRRVVVAALAPCEMLSHFFGWQQAGNIWLCHGRCTACAFLAALGLLETCPCGCWSAGVHVSCSSACAANAADPWPPSGGPLRTWKCTGKRQSAAAGQVYCSRSMWRRAGVLFWDRTVLLWMSAQHLRFAINR